jgi:hypothetical protein
VNPASEHAGRTRLSAGLTVVGGILLMSGAIMALVGEAMRLKPSGELHGLVNSGKVIAILGLGCGVAALAVVVAGESGRRRSKRRKPQGRAVRDSDAAAEWLNPFRPVRAEYQPQHQPPQQRAPLRAAVGCQRPENAGGWRPDGTDGWRRQDTGGWPADGTDGWRRQDTGGWPADGTDGWRRDSTDVGYPAGPETTADHQSHWPQDPPSRPEVTFQPGYWAQAQRDYQDPPDYRAPSVPMQPGYDLPEHGSSPGSGHPDYLPPDYLTRQQPGQQDAAESGWADAGWADSGWAASGWPDSGWPNSGGGGAEEPASDWTHSGSAGTDRPGTDRPGTDRPGTDRPGTDRPGTDRPGSGWTGSGETDSDGADDAEAAEDTCPLPVIAAPGRSPSAPGPSAPGPSAPGPSGPDNLARPDGHARPPDELQAIPMRGPFEAFDRSVAAQPEPMPAQVLAKLDQLKDLYLTAEAIGEDALTKHFDEVSLRQRQLIKEYFAQAGFVLDGTPQP